MTCSMHAGNEKCAYSLSWLNWEIKHLGELGVNRGIILKCTLETHDMKMCTGLNLSGVSNHSKNLSSIEVINSLTN